MSAASRGEIWDADFGRTRGREQAGVRPALIISVDAFNQSAADLVFAIPITTKAKPVRSHVLVQPPEGGLAQVSFIKCEDARSMSVQRLLRRRGMVSSATLQAVEDRLRVLLGL